MKYNTVLRYKETIYVFTKLELDDGEYWVRGRGIMHYWLDAVYDEDFPDEVLFLKGDRTEKSWEEVARYEEI